MITQYVFFKTNKWLLHEVHDVGRSIRISQNKFAHQKKWSNYNKLFFLMLLSLLQKI